MPEQKQVTWAQLRVGIMVLVSLTVFAVAIFFISGQVGFLSRKYTLKAYFSDAGGLREGSPVQVAGIAAGNVRRIRMSPFTDPARAVEVEMSVTTALQGQIRADSEAELESTGLLGEKHVNITRGSPNQPALKDGGVVKSREEADIKRIVQNTNDVIVNLRVLSSKLNDVAAQIQSAQGSLGKLIYDQAFYNHLTQTAGGIQRLVAKIERGEGTLGKLMSDETLYERTVASLERVNRLIEDAQHGPGSLGRFISDPSVYNNVNRAVTQAHTLIENINQGHGTLGKLATDPHLYNRVNNTIDRVNVITARIEQGEGTMGKLSTDPTLYNNLSESSRVLRDFLAEFRKNPKKYLSIRVRLF